VDADRQPLADTVRAPHGGLVVDDEELTLTGSIDNESTYDVLMNGRHVWSLRPDRDAVTAAGAATATWPAALKRFLVGRADVTVQEHVSGEVVGTAHHAFGGDSTREVMVKGARGQHMVVDKYGRLIRPLSAEHGGGIDELLDAAEELLETLREKLGVPSYLCYGTLLGAVRNGKLIAHDNDIDVAYLSNHEHPADVARESYRIERFLRQEGWDVRRGSGVRLNVRLRVGDRSMRCVDVFTSHWLDGILYMPQDTGFPLPREVILPLGSVELMGRKFPAPADTQRLLAATYGEGWRVPDPSFRYHTPRWLSRRISGWYGGLVTHRKFWDSFNNNAPPRVRNHPSPFARWVARHYPSARPLIDLGCGTGRDALWFARRTRRPVTGIDYSIGPVKRGNRFTEERNLPAAFEVLNLYDARAVLALGARLAREDEPVDLYARFTPHALNEPGYQHLLRLASMSLRCGGFMFLEFRTHRDADKPHVFGEHFRRYLDPQLVAADIEAAGGRIVHHEEGTGLAPFEDEDPDICRIVATWARDQRDGTG
jgi:hypothetical protein